MCVLGGVQAVWCVRVCCVCKPIVCCVLYVCVCVCKPCVCGVLCVCVSGVCTSYVCGVHAVFVCVYVGVGALRVWCVCGV